MKLLTYIQEEVEKKGSFEKNNRGRTSRDWNQKRRRSIKIIVACNGNGERINFRN